MKNKKRGLSVAFLAPDGGGKSTIIKGITESCGEYFAAVSYFHFRPEWLKNLGQIHISNPTQERCENREPGTEPPPNAAPHDVKLQSRLKSFVRFMYYNVDFILGTYFRINPLKRKNHLIVFDRYYYDYFADTIRYKYNLSQNLIRFFSRFIPKPDIVFILDADTEVIWNRKREVPMEEVARQRTAYASILDMNLNGVLVDVDRDVDTIVEEVASRILRCSGAAAREKELQSV